jgi:chromosome segregation ATPase
LEAVIQQKNKFEISLREVHLELRRAQELLEERNKQLAELNAKQASTEKLLKEEAKKYIDLKAIITTQIRLLKDEKVQLQEEIDGKSHKVGSLEAENPDLSEEVSVLKKHNVLEIMKQRKLMSDLQNLEDQKDAAEHNLQSAKDQVSQLKRDMNMRGEDLEQARFRLATIERENAAMFEQLEEAKKEQQKLAHQIRSKLEPKLIEHEKKNSEFEARGEQTRREMSELIDKFRKANKKVAKHKELSGAHEENVNNLKSELKRSRAITAKVKRDNKELEDDNHGLKAKERRMREENDELQIENDRLQAEVTSLKIPQTKTTFSAVRYEVIGVTRARTNSDSSSKDSSDSD